MTKTISNVKKRLDDYVFNVPHDAKNTKCKNIKKSFSELFDKNILKENFTLPNKNNKELLVKKEPIVKKKDETEVKELNNDNINQAINEQYFVKNSNFNDIEKNKIKQKQKQKLVLKHNQHSLENLRLKEIALEKNITKSKISKEIKQDKKTIDTSESNKSNHDLLPPLIDRYGTDAIVKNQVNCLVEKELTTPIKNLNDVLHSEIKEFQTNEYSSKTITIKIKPSNLGEIVILLNKQKDEQTNSVYNPSGRNSIEVSILSVSSSAATYLNLIKKELKSSFSNILVSTQEQFYTKNKRLKSSTIGRFEQIVSSPADWERD